MTGCRGVGEREHRRQDREVLRDVVRDRERRQCAARDQQLLADFDDLDQLGRVGVEVDHIAGLLGRGRAGVHGHADVRLRECGSVVRSVARHRDHAPFRLLLLDQGHLRLRRRFRKEVVDPRLFRDHGGRHAVVTRDHHGANAHAPQLVEALVHPALDDVLQMHDAKCPVVAGDDEGRAALLGDTLNEPIQLGGRQTALLQDEPLDCVAGALADQCAVHVHAAHARGCAERDELVLAQLALA